MLEAWILTQHFNCLKYILGYVLATNYMLRYVVVAGNR